MPVVSHTPLPVDVLNFPGPDIYLKVSVAVALIALLVAVVTLMRVNKQISIATEELKAVKDDFELAQKQFREVTRRPKVTVGVGLTKPQPDNPAVFTPFFNLLNRGDKLSRHIMLELLVPASDLAKANPYSIVFQTATQVNGIAYTVFTTTHLEPLYPNGVILPFGFQMMNMKPEVVASRLLFRAYDENFAYPRGGYGEITFSVSGPTPMSRVFATEDSA